MIPSFHTADRPTHRRVMVVGLLLCLGFVVISFSLRPQAEEGRGLVEADKLVRTGGDPHRRTDAAFRRPSAVRQFLARRFVIGRDGNEAGIADHIDQNFHPYGHEAPFPVSKLRGGGISSCTSGDQTREIAWLLITAEGRGSPAQQKPAHIRGWGRVFRAFTSRKVAALD